MIEQQAARGGWVLTTDGQLGIITALTTGPAGAAVTVTTPDLTTYRVAVDGLRDFPMPSRRYVTRYLAVADSFADPGYAAQYRALGLGPAEAAGWANRGFAPSEAASWSAAGFTAHEATRYAQRRIGAQHARELATWPPAVGMLAAA